MSRLLIVSNRLPVTVKLDHGEIVVTQSAGGLATGLRGPHQRSESLWLGWPGDVSRLDAGIGVFLHIPFPSAEVFRILPWRIEILEGMLGADLVGFHTYSYLKHFRRALHLILGIDAHSEYFHHRDREVRLGVFPMGIDA